VSETVKGCIKFQVPYYHTELVPFERLTNFQGTQSEFVKIPLDVIILEWKNNLILPKGHILYFVKNLKGETIVIRGCLSTTIFEFKCAIWQKEQIPPA
jgi:hypothetical protein